MTDKPRIPSAEKVEDLVNENEFQEALRVMKERKAAAEKAAKEPKKETEEATGESALPSNKRGIIEIFKRALEKHKTPDTPPPAKAPVLPPATLPGDPQFFRPAPRTPEVAQKSRNSNSIGSV